LSNVKLLGFVSEEDLPFFYTITDILVAAPKTLTECMGQSIKEAMACARATVVADIGGGPEAISHMNNGLLFEAGNPEALKKAIETLIDNPSLRATLGTNALLIARSKFDAKTCSEETLILFEKLVKEAFLKGNS
jgi:glycosyltransferase involved in cell wall biosynthesis